MPQQKNMQSKEATILLKKVKKKYPKAGITTTPLGEMITVKKEFDNVVQVVIEIVVDSPKDYFVHARTINPYFNTDTKKAFDEAFVYMQEQGKELATTEW